MRRFYIAFIFFLIFFRAEAGPGDTTVVQFFTFGSVRDSSVLFPSDTVSYEKILMYYTLKCDPSQYPPCGEWDYLTYTLLYEHTGMMDSTQYLHPNFIVEGDTPDSLLLMNQSSWRYEWDYQYTNQGLMTDSAILGNPDAYYNLPSCSCGSDAHFYFLWNQAELIQAGLDSGDVTALRFNLAALGGEIKHLKIKLKNTSYSSLDGVVPPDTGFTLVYNKHTNFTQTGWNTLYFTWPFSWDASSNILIDVSMSKHESSGNSTLVTDSSSFVSGLISDEQDYHLDFGTSNFIDVPGTSFNTVDSSVTISFWAYGDLNVLPKNNSIFEGRDINDKRKLNVHLPWSDNKIYWDAGNDGSGYDRIYKAASIEEIGGRWNHWAFVKNVYTGSMKIYLNGSLWHSGTGNNKTMEGISDFLIGSQWDGSGNYYDGKVDEFRIWNEEIPDSVIQDWMYVDLDTSHPYYQHLVAYFPFNEGKTNKTLDHSPTQETAQLIGMPDWKSYRGEERFRNFVPYNYRPYVVFENGTYNAANMDSVFVMDSLAKNQLMVIMFSDTIHPNTNIPTDTLYKWPSYYNNYVFDSSGNTIDSLLVQADTILYKEEHPYWEAPFEVINTYEIARYITPYGYGIDLGNDGFTWVFDVTDYRSLLADSVHISAGNWQELLDLKFMMIEGIPERDVVKFEQLWRGTYYLDEIDQTIAPQTIKADSAAKMFRLKTRASGHDFSNATNCAEFCPKIHSVVVNGTQVDSWQIIQECADNPLFPQGGTWIYDRAGWCPGEKVTTRDVEITDYMMLNDSNSIDYNSQTDPYGNYRFVGQLISYGDPNFITNASLEEILAPNDMKYYGRLNPICGSPVVRIKNSGSDPLTSLDVKYGAGSVHQSYQWTGNLDFTESEIVTLDPMSWNNWNGNSHFYVSLSNPNGVADEYPQNDSGAVTFYTTPALPTTFIIWLKTNSAASETYYEIRDTHGNVHWSRSGLSNNTWYKDTITLTNGCYALQIDDTDDDGISFWANNDGSGSFSFRRLNGSIIKIIEPDFGKEIAYRFTVGYLMNTEEIKQEVFLDVYPNPSDGILNISYALANQSKLKLQVRDMMGRTVHEEELTNSISDMLRINLSEKQQGMYYVSLVGEGFVETRKVMINR